MIPHFSTFTSNFREKREVYISTCAMCTSRNSEQKKNFKIKFIYYYLFPSPSLSLSLSLTRLTPSTFNQFSLDAIVVVLLLSSPFFYFIFSQLPPKTTIECMSRCILHSLSSVRFFVLSTAAVRIIVACKEN
jgi:hypothetical protein